MGALYRYDPTIIVVAHSIITTNISLSASEYFESFYSDILCLCALVCLGLACRVYVMCRFAADEEITTASPSDLVPAPELHRALSLI